MFCGRRSSLAVPLLMHFEYDLKCRSTCAWTCLWSFSRSLAPMSCTHTQSQVPAIFHAYPQTSWHLTENKTHVTQVKWCRPLELVALLSVKWHYRMIVRTTAGTGLLNGPYWSMLRLHPKQVTEQRVHARVSTLQYGPVYCFVWLWISANSTCLAHAQEKKIHSMEYSAIVKVLCLPKM